MKYIISEDQYRKIAQSISEMGENDIHLKTVMAHYDDSDLDRQIEMTHVITGKRKADRNRVYNALREMGYLEILDVQYELNILDME